MSWFDDNMPQSGAQGITDPGQGPQAGMPGMYFDDATGQYRPLATGGGGQAAAPAAGGGNPTDRNYVMQQVQQTGQQMQAAGQYVNPSVLNDPGYWADRIIEKGGWVNNGPNQNNIDYFSGRFGMAEGDPRAGGGGAGAGGGNLQMGAYTLPGAAQLGAGTGLWNPNDPTGQSSLATLAAQGLTSSPGYQFRLQQGIDALQRSAAAKGTLLTGGTAKAFERYGSDFASNEYANQYNRLLGEQTTGYGQRADAARLGLAGQGQYAGQLYSLANLGLNAAGQQATLGAGYGNAAGNILGSQATNMSNLITGQGNAASAGTIGAANAQAQGLAGVANAGTNAAQQYYLYQLMQGRNAGSVAPSGAYGPYGAGYGNATTNYTIPPSLSA